VTQSNPYWTELVRRLKPYVPGEQPRDKSIVKLNTNESPYAPSPKVLAAIRNAANESLRLYPDTQALALREAIADHYDVSVENVFVGNGSDEVLALSFMAFFKDGRVLQFPDISYSFYPVYCNLFDIPFTAVPLAEDLTLNLSDFRADAGVIFPNPNAPTSLALAQEDVSDLLSRHDSAVVVVDEAYVDFGAQTMAPLVKQFPNLLITQTFSKSRSLAGLRAGFAIADVGLVRALERVKDSFNSYPLDTIAQTAAAAAMQDKSYFDECCARVVNTREITGERMRRLGLSVLDSKTNFLFACYPNRSGAELFQALRNAGFLTRHWQSPRIEQYLRITIGTEDQMQAFVKALEKVVA